MRRLLFLSLVMAAMPLRAAPPVDGKSFPGGRGPCRVNKQAMGERLAALRSARALGTLPARNALTNPKVLVIRVAFSDVAMTATLAQTQALFQQVRDYYLENSYGALQATFTVTAAVYTLPGNEAFYGADCGTDIACNTSNLFSAATSAAAGDVTFTNFDHLIIYHAGQGQESDPSNTDLVWSVYMDENRTAGGKTFTGYPIVPETEGPGLSPHGVACHEYGHQLGLPDLYDTGAQISTLGKWDVMDYPYGATPADTPHFGAWSKFYLGFSSPVPSTGTVVLAPAETSPNAVRLPHPGANESFLMEYRLRSAGTFDKSAAVAAGMALWHIDEDLVLGGGSAMLNNVVNAPGSGGNGTGHRGVDVVEADGIQSVGTDYGNNDLFGNGDVAGTDRTISFGGVPSGMTVIVVSGSGGPALTLNIVSFAAAPSLAILRVANYPNPGGDVSRHPVRAGAPTGTVTTLVIQLAKPVNADEIRFDLYDMNGERLRSVSGSLFTLKAGTGEPTADGKWVYEHDWDGKDEGGRNLSSGVYFYRVKIGSETKTGKLAILR